MPAHAHLSERDRDGLMAYLFDSDESDPRAAESARSSAEPEWVFAGYTRFLDEEA